MSVMSDIRENSGTKRTSIITRENFELDEEDIERLIEESLEPGSQISFSWSSGQSCRVYVEIVTTKEE